MLLIALTIKQPYGTPVFCGPVAHCIYSILTEDGHRLVFTDSSEVLYSKEGVTQGDPLSMFAYAVATLRLIKRIGRPNEGRDVWYADDASACAPLCDLKD